MSVLIKGMEMPTSCWQCFARTDVNIGVGIADGCALLKEMISNLNERLDDCPLVPVPPHGRVIDADALPRFGGRKGLIHSADVDNAPTIIPAEEGE